MKKLQFLKAGDYMKTITRAKYLDRIIELNGTPDIKIITGIRRSGKSKLMQAYIAYLKSNFENINIIFIDFMDLAYEEIKEYVGRAEEYKAAKSALLEGLGLEHLFDHSHELTPKEKEIWMLFDRVDVAELLARDAFAKGAYMLGAEDREIMLK